MSLYSIVISILGCVQEMFKLFHKDPRFSILQPSKGMQKLSGASPAKGEVEEVGSRDEN